MIQTLGYVIVAELFHHLAGKALVVHRRRRYHLTEHHHHVLLDHHLDCNLGVAVLREARVNHGICYRVTDFVGVAVAYCLGREHEALRWGHGLLHRLLLLPLLGLLLHRLRYHLLVIGEIVV